MILSNCFIEDKSDTASFVITIAKPFHGLRSINNLKAGEIEETNDSGLETYRSGWIFVTRDYLDSADEINSQTQSITESNDNKSAYSSLYKLVSKDQSSSISRSTSDITSTYTSDITKEEHPESNQSQHVANQEKIRSSQRKHRYFAMLKHGNLFLYKDETLKDVKHVIVLSTFFVTLWPRGLTDAQLFTKYSAIALINAHKMTTTSESAPRGSFFIYCDVNSDKEDWYFALIRATKVEKTELPSTLNPAVHAKTLHFDTKDMINLIQTLYSSEGQLQTKWLNALLGRIFLSMKGTKKMEDYIHKKLSKKLDKIKKPGFLDKFQIRSIYPGDAAPFLTKPSLKEINPDGTVILSAYISYTGGLSVTISTKANINLGAKFTKGEVDVVLRVTLCRFEGPVLVKIKPPPTGRIWYSYEIEPTMNIKIEPVISSRQITYNLITNYMEKKIKEAIKESLVLPNWDDITFYETTEELYRAGIWDPNRHDLNAESNSGSVTTNSSGAEDTGSTDGFPPLTEDDIEAKSELSAKLANSKTKLTNTLTDLSNKMKKKSTSTLSNQASEPDGKALRTDGDSTTNNSMAMNTLKKIGKWYFKDDKARKDDTYTPPEMISSRRQPRRPSNASSSPNNEFKYHKNESNSLHPYNEQENKVHKVPSYDFGKLDTGDDVHSSIFASPIHVHQEGISVMSGDDASIRSELLVSEPTVGLTQPSRARTITRKPPPKSPLLEPSETLKTETVGDDSIGKDTENRDMPTTKPPLPPRESTARTPPALPPREVNTSTMSLNGENENAVSEEVSISGKSTEEIHSL
ncbi:uncharacterized protein J8A68_002206 [[Candida] subhashii]|uniref:SMP-LTD domain-containing protein n=1 Tax=[Candida] subhashii TaxID=561895 RepID=A0A8J5UPU7_9ASCO|nr:uncharacterized protein J8A68_002206 [[Candida] subhashii]KAG7664291.1 hypothetical protein J8A68_002206 [[Candida] subhashii]